MTREQFLSVRFNNSVSISLGLIVVVYTLAVLFSGAWSTSAGFTGMVIISSVF